DILDRVRNDRVAPLIIARLAYADDALLAEYAGLMADQYEALGRVDDAACYRYAAKGADTALVILLPPELKQREMAMSERLLRATRRRAPVGEVTTQAIYRTIFERLAAEFGAAQVRLLGDP